MHGVECEVETLPCTGWSGDSSMWVKWLNQPTRQSGSGNESVVDWECKKTIDGISVILAYLCH